MPLLLARLTSRLRPQRIFYGWYIAFAGLVNNFLLVGVIVLGFSVFYEPMRAELGWSMTAILAGVSVRSFQQGFLSPIAGHFVDRFGPRNMALTGVTIVTVGLLLYSQSRDLWVYYLASVIIALGQSLGSFNAYSLSMMNWFQRKRGRAMGILNTGNALGYFAVPVLAALTATFGWRTTLVIAACVLFLLGIPMALVLRSRPQPYGYLPDGDHVPEMKREAGDGPEPAPTVLATPPLTGLTVAEALRTPAFYLLALTSAASSICFTTWLSTHIPHLFNVGYSAAAVGVFVSVYGVLQSLIRVGAGWVADTVGRRRLLVASFLLLSSGLVAFAFFSPERVWLIPVFYLTFGLGHTGSVVTGQALAADYYGTRRFATIQGLSQSLTVPAGVTGPVVAGWLFDTTGSYQTAYLMLAAATLTGALWPLLIRRPLWRDVQSSATASPAKAI